MTVLDTLKSEATALIRDEVRAAAQRDRLLAASVQAIKTYGLSIDEVSAETGLTVDDLNRALVADHCADEDLAKLAGIR